MIVDFRAAFPCASSSTKRASRCHGRCEQRLFLHESGDMVGFKVSKYSNFGMVMQGNSEILFLQPTVVPLNHAAFGAPFMDISDVELGGAPGAQLRESRRSSRHYKGL